MPLWIIIIFISMFAVVLMAVGLGLKFVEDHRRRQVTGMLRTVSGETPLPETTLLVEPAAGDSVERVLGRFTITQKLETDIQQAGMDWTVPKLLMMMLIGAGVGVLISLKLQVVPGRLLNMLGFAVLVGLLPYFHVRRTRKSRLSEFEAQFPDALDFLARSMRAGHAFTVSLEMLAEESPDPISREIRQAFNEQNLGAPVEVALKNLAVRVPLVDVGFFVSAVLLQKETGGNLSEILTKLSYVIRERFRLRGRVRAVSAHGRITGLVLTFMPMVLVLILSVLNPSYLPLMVNDPDGRWMIAGTIVGQILGYIFIRKIVDIKV
jgi:tight adherence protein B